MAALEDLIVPCPSCGKKNRIPPAKSGLKPICGQCGTPLDPGSAAGKPTAVTDLDFETEVLQSALPVLLDCWAPWCGPCRMVGPVIDELAAQWRGRVKIAKLNTDENPRTAARFQIRSIPTLLIFDQGRLVDTIVGAVPKTEIERKMARFL
ncbi:MAG: thioredoxin TrxC [Pseudomonadota bacterium]